MAAVAATRKRAARPAESRQHKKARKVAEIASASPIPLTFRDAWMKRKVREDALWLDVPVSSESLLASTLREFTTQHGVSSPSCDTVVGFQVAPFLWLVGLVTRQWTNGDRPVAIVDASTPTVMPIRELFPGTSQKWCTCLVELIMADVAVVEVRPLEQKTSRAKTPMKTTAEGWRLRVGVNWRRYMRRYFREPVYMANSRLLSSESMREVMLWTLMNSQDLVEQWTYPYPKELGVLYSAVIIDGEEELARAPPAKFDIGDVYVRIDVDLQLQRDTTALARDDRLVPKLRPYQNAAVSWMLERERDASTGLGRASIGSCVRFTKKTSVQYDPFQARFFSDGHSRSAIEDEAPVEFNLADVRGGILADEMGLGKTIEVITLILAHPPSCNKPQMTNQRAVLISPEHPKDKEDVKNCICGSDIEHARGWVRCDHCGSLHHRLCTGYDKARGGFVFTLPGTCKKKTWVPSSSFMCFVCQSEIRPEIESKATLIVSPEAIQTQWELECTRHVKPGALSVLRYPGVKAVGSRFVSNRARKPSADWQILATAYYMSAFDVILTTYEILGSDLHYLPSESGTERRTSTRQTVKKYPFIASPLVSTTFWRVCMDEAQVGVENTRLSLAMTVAQLRAVNTWVVTGTPFSTSIVDLYGALKFLRAKPFSEEDTGLAFFKSVVEKCFAGGAVERVFDMLLWDGQRDAAGERTTRGGGMLWRTSRSDVLNQLDVPAQHNDLVWCRFSRIERHFYESQAAKVLAQIRSESMEACTTLDNALWNELLQLRQLCCHPVVSSKLARANVRTVDDLLATMLRNACAAYRTTRREYARSQNVLAAIHAVDNNHLRAIELYVQSYDLLHEDASATQPQYEHVMLHTVVNLVEIVRYMTLQPATVSTMTRIIDCGLAKGNARALADRMPKLKAIRRSVADNCWVAHPSASDLREDVDALEAYAVDLRAWIMSSEESGHKKALAEAQDSWCRTNSCFSSASWTPVGSTPASSQPSSWWKDLLVAIERDGGVRANGFADSVRESLVARSTTWSIQFASSFQSVNGLRRAVTDEWGALASQRRALKSALDAYCGVAPTEVSLKQSRKCRQCTCSYLCTEEHFCGSCNLECKLARFHFQLIGEIDKLQHGRSVYKYAQSEAPLAILDAFKAIASAAKAIGHLDSIRAKEVVDRETAKWDAIKESLAAAQALLSAQRQRFRALGRIVEAIKRVSLEEDAVYYHAHHPTLYDHYALTLPAADVAHNLQVLKSRSHDERRDLDRIRGKWRFIRSLDAQRRQEKQQQRPQREECAVCWLEMKPERIMLPCAHSFCHSCVYSVAGTSARCPMCRYPFAISDVTLVCPDEETLKQDNYIEYGCKVDAIVRRVMALAKGEATVKCLLFSQWQSMLTMTKSVLEEHGVKCFIFTTKRELPATLDAFKRFAGDAPSVLALPYRHGANGLNLMEATHVLLAEPPLNGAIEKQAVSRVYRIGQSRETIVHHFVVRDSVEERIYRSRHASENRRDVFSCSRGADYKTSIKEKNGEERISMDEVRALLLSPAMAEEEEDKTEEGAPSR